MSAADAVTETGVAIVGAGLAGLGAAIALRREGRDDFVVLERADDLGGTWRDNTYPGCACDIPSVLYSYRDEPNPGWSRAWALQPEIQRYLQGVADRHDLRRSIRFGHELLSASFDPDRGRWEIDTTGGRISAEVLVAATGALADPVIPELPGLESFSGAIFHSARWDHERSLDGRRVAVIGTGASAIQFVPELQQRVEHLTLFQRTPPWVLPRNNVAIPRAWRRAFARYPRLEALARGGVFSIQEATHFGFTHPIVMRLSERQGLRHIAAGVPDPQLRARLTPTFRLGCKRVLFSNRWYPALAAANVDVVSDAIAEVVGDGIVDAAGVHHAVDTIIFATGFRPSDPPIAHRLRGPDGETLARRWAGSPRSYLGTAVAGFPNLFFLLGPNTGLGHNSVILMIEAQIAHVIDVLRHRSLSGAGAVAPTAAAQDAWTREVDRGTDGSVWSDGGCLSWYIDATGRNSVLWPGSVRAYQRRLATFDPAAYEWGAPVPEPALA